MLNLKRTQIEISGKTVTLWLNQPETRNALNPIIISELTKCIKWVSGKKEIMVILIRGRGDSFCAGADINWMMESGLLRFKKSYKESKKLAECFKTIYQSDKVIINLIHGHAFGGALGFLGASDFTFAVKNTVFSLPELKLGLTPSVISPYLLTRLKLADIKYKIFTSSVFTADEALEAGLIDKVCEDMNDMEYKSNELVQNICSASPKAVSEVKYLFRLLNKNLINSRNIKKTIKSITKMKMSEDARIRMSEFVNKKQQTSQKII